jgi:hypothetical protein
LKWNLGRYLESQGTRFATNVNPAIANQTTTRTWTDTNSNFIAECDFTNPAANGECGRKNNQNFGQPVVSVRYTPDGVTGWGTRGYDWETMVGVQHELRPGLSAATSYHLRWFGNFRLTDNVLLRASDFDPFCMTAPTDSRLRNAVRFLVDYATG